MQIHNWQPIKRADTPKGKQDWWCGHCDSVLRYDVRLTRRDVHILAIRGGFICRPPLPNLSKLGAGKGKQGQHAIGHEPGKNEKNQKKKDIII